MKSVSLSHRSDSEWINNGDIAQEATQHRHVQDAHGRFSLLFSGGHVSSGRPTPAAWPVSPRLGIPQGDGDAATPEIAAIPAVVLLARAGHVDGDGLGGRHWLDDGVRHDRQRDLRRRHWLHWRWLGDRGVGSCGPHNDHIAAQSLDELGVVRVKDSLGHICFVYAVHGRWNSAIPARDAHQGLCLCHSLGRNAFVLLWYLSNALPNRPRSWASSAAM